MKLDKNLKARLETASQEWLVDHLEQLDEPRRDTLLGQLETIDFDLVARLRATKDPAAEPGGQLVPVPYVSASERGSHTAAARRGIEELDAGHVGFAILAGGQASRLRWDGPKGTFPIGPGSERSLFQILVEQIVRAGRDHGHVPPLAITTSSTTDAAIKVFFERHDCFGMERERLNFAAQGALPALDDDGRLMLAAPERVFTNPDGHGGAVTALETRGILEAWEAAGITTVCSLQVDNPLLAVVDADFIGRLWTDEVPLATKVILKERPEQKLGVVVRLGGRPAIVEYSEITEEQANARDDDGQLTYRLGSIAVHAFRIDFLRRELAGELPLHTARKEIPCLDGEGEPVRRTGIKYERFLFDLFPRADDLAVVEVRRDREYEPVKNAEGAESPATASKALTDQYRRWYREAGREPPDGEEPFELSPLDVNGPDDLKEE